MAESNDTTATPPPELDLRSLAVGAERPSWLGDLIRSFRNDIQPRNAPERHLTDELSVNRWRLLRVHIMEKAIYQHQMLGFRPRSPSKPDGQPVELYEDMFHMAMSHSQDLYALILSALSHLESRYNRQFNAALRLLMAMRRENPFLQNEPKENLQTKRNREKDQPSCNLSPSPSPV